MAASNAYPSIRVVKARHDDDQPVTAVISQRVPGRHQADYERWMQDISEAARQFPGHMGITVIRPEAGICVEFVIILKFDCYTNLKRWLDSEERQRWLDKAQPFIAKQNQIQILTGLETWFTLPSRAVQGTPARYKMALLTTLAVFVTVNLFNPILLPLLTQVLPQLLASLIATYLVVLTLTYGVMPRLTKLFRRWLYPQ
ncbi:MAG: antibiotic biosynthesis monooxygenase [Cyanobacteria bacterium P01_F01_bin.56]